MTVAGQNSVAASEGIGVGLYPSAEAPHFACDGNIQTKSLNFGNCTQQMTASTCGLDTGFYITHLENASRIIGFRICTANDAPERDPTNVTLEGSNRIGTELTLGSSWTLIYQGISGLQVNPGRTVCGSIVLFSNTLGFNSYRFLITAKRGNENSVQFSELKLIVA